MNNEIWKDIDGYEGYYQVSNKGRVRRANGNILNPWNNQNGYPMVALCKHGKSKCFLVHRLVAFMFIPNPRKVNVVNHKDGSRNNNCVENLEWCTQKENLNLAITKERMSKAVKKRYENHEYPNIKPVRCVETGKVYPSAVKAGEELGFNRKQISKCLKGHHNTAGGFHWELVD